VLLSETVFFGRTRLKENSEKTKTEPAWPETSLPGISQNFTIKIAQWVEWSSKRDAL